MNSMYYDRSKLMSYNKLFNFSVGARGIGKTYQMKDLAISKFLKEGRKTFYLRRWAVELENVIKVDRFFADIGRDYPDYLFMIKDNVGYIKNIKDCDSEAEMKEREWQDFIYFGALANSAIKSASFPDVSYIIFDEFIPMQGRIRYIKGEVERFLELYETIARTRDVRVFFIANAVSMINPYFTYFKCNLQQDTYTVYPEIVIEKSEAKDFTKFKKETRFAKVIQGTHYESYAIDNNWLLDNNVFVETRPKSGRCLYNIKTLDGTLFVWFCEGRLYICLEGDASTFSLAFDDDTHNEHTYKLSDRSTYFCKTLKKYYELGKMRFGSMKAKSIFFNNCIKLIT